MQLNPDGLKRSFKEVGVVVHATAVSHDRVAYVTFKHPKDAENARVGYDGGEINGRCIKITCV